MSDKLAEVIDDEYLRQCVTVDEFAIDDEMMRAPSDYTYWNQKYSDACKDFYLAEIDAQVAEATLSAVHRADLMPDDDDDAKKKKKKAPTETEIKMAMRADPRWKAAQVKVAVSEVEKKRLYGIVSAIDLKMRALQSVAAKMRAEMMADPAMRELRREERAAHRERSIRPET